MLYWPAPPSTNSFCTYALHILMSPSIATTPAPTIPTPHPACHFPSNNDPPLSKDTLLL